MKTNRWQIFGAIIAILSIFVMAGCQNKADNQPESSASSSSVADNDFKQASDEVKGVKAGTYTVGGTGTDLQPGHYEVEFEDSSFDMDDDYQAAAKVVGTITVKHEDGEKTTYDFTVEHDEMPVVLRNNDTVTIKSDIKNAKFDFDKPSD